MTIFQKINFLLSVNQRRELIILTFLLFIGMIFEMLGLGVLLPALSLMLKNDIAVQYPSIRPFLEFIGNPTQYQLILWFMGTLVLLYFIKALFLIYLSWRQSRFSSMLSAELSRKLFLGYLRMPYTFHLNRNSAELLRNIQSEIAIFTALSQGVIALSTEISVIVSVAFILILVEPVGAISIALFIGLFGFVFYRMTRKKILNWGERRQYHVGLMTKHLLQGFGGVKDIKLMGRENQFLGEFSEHNLVNANILTRIQTLAQVPRLYLEFLAVAALAGLIIIFVVQNKSLELLIPTMGIFVAAAFRMLPSVNRIMAAIQNITYSKPVVNVLYDEFQLVKQNDINENAGSKIEFVNEIEIRKIGFNYEGAQAAALKNVSIKIEKGACVGFIGQSGSGKSTLIDLILGLLKPSSGHILVDGADIYDNLRSWQDQIGYVPQSIYLTDDTLRCNIAFGLPNELIDDVKVQIAIEAAQLDEFIMGLPEKLETIVGERGVRLSGGQRQRIGIARALYNNPQILVLDEATSALDNDTEKGVMDALDAMRGQRTLIIVAHRLSTVQSCDKLFKLENGEIVDQGEPARIIKITTGSY